MLLLKGKSYVYAEDVAVGEHHRHVVLIHLGARVATDELGVGAVCVWQGPGQNIQARVANRTVGVFD